MSGLKVIGLLLMVGLAPNGLVRPAGNHDRRLLPARSVNQQPNAYADTVSVVAGAIPLARNVLGLSDQHCARLFSLPDGVTADSLLSEVEIVYADLHDADVYAMEYDPSEAKNPRPGRFAVVFNTGAGNPNISGGPAEAANTLVHELIHVAYGKFGGQAVSGAMREGWVNDDGGDDPASQAAQEWNDRIVQLSGESPMQITQKPGLFETRTILDH